MGFNSGFKGLIYFWQHSPGWVMQVVKFLPLWNQRFLSVCTIQHHRYSDESSPQPLYCLFNTLGSNAGFCWMARSIMQGPLWLQLENCDTKGEELSQVHSCMVLITYYSWPEYTTWWICSWFQRRNFIHHLQTHKRKPTKWGICVNVMADSAFIHVRACREESNREQRWSCGREKPSIIVNYMTNMGRVDTVHQYSVRLCPLEDSEMVVKIVLLGYEGCNNKWIHSLSVGRDSVVSITARYRLDSLGIKSRWGRNFPHPSSSSLGPTQPPIQWVSGLSRGMALTSHSHLVLKLNEE